MLSLGFIILFAHEFADQKLNSLLLNVMQKESSSFAFVAFGVFANSLLIIWILPLFFISFLQKFHPETEMISFTTKMMDYTREWLKGMGQASLWMFVLVIPGIIRWVEYSMLPFICFFDQSYQNGDTEALSKCRDIIRGNRLKLWFIWLLLGIVFPLILTSFFSEFESLSEHPILGSLLVLSNTVFQTLGFWLLWKLYLKASQSAQSAI